MRAPIGTSSTPDTGRARRTWRRRSSIVVHAPGHGWSARTWRSISTAGRRQSIQPSARVKGWTCVAARSSWGSVSIVARGPALEDRRHDLGGKVRQPRLQLGCRLAAGQRHRPALDDRPGVELLGHHHQRHAALRVASLDRAGHRRRPAVAREERRVDVQRRSTAQRQEARRHDLAVRDEDEPIGVVAGELLARLVRTQARRRHDADAALSCGGGDRRGSQLEPPAGRPIRLADDEQLVGEIGHALEQRHAEGAGAEEGDAPDATH